MEWGVNFLTDITEWDGDILTNPPYKYALEFVNHSLDIIPNGNKVIMLLKLTFLESQQRRKLWDTKQLKTLYVTSKRTSCAINGDFKNNHSGALAYGWYEWVKGYDKDPIIKWFN